MWPRGQDGWTLPILGIVVGTIALRGAIVEWQDSPLQSWFFSRWAQRLTYAPGEGTSPSIRFPHSGPYDARLGYGLIPGFIARLTAGGYAIDSQARLSPELVWLTERGLYAGYREKTQAGLTLLDRRGQPLHAARYPARVYGRFDAVPRLVRDALTFMEDRTLLEDGHPERNPAVDPKRLGRALIEQGWRAVAPDHPAAGGSTLATQLEKIRHSPGGRTASAGDKLRQMAAASLRAYRDGGNTLAARRQVLVDYLDSLPLLAQAGRGEIQGLGDGLTAWYGRDFDEVNRLLEDADPAIDRLTARALAFKQVLSLLIAQRRPARYLGPGDALERKTDSYLRLLAEAGVIDARLRDVALAQPLARIARASPEPFSFVDRKAATGLRVELAGLLGVPGLYDLDRLDLAVNSSLDAAAQQAVTRRLLSFAEPEGARAAGLYGFRLLAPGDDPGRLVWGFSLFERGAGGNLLRVQTDSLDQPFDVNRGARLDLGSTAKLRTLVSYLQVVAELHGRLAPLDAAALGVAATALRDPLSRWAAGYLARADDRDLPPMLEAALERRYAANPGEAFFTGGGVQRFGNYDPRDNGRVLSVREAFENSVNLVFVRLMRDLVAYYAEQAVPDAERVLADAGEPRRTALLARFAELEGSEFLADFYLKYRDKSAEEVEALLLAGVRPLPLRVAAVLRSLEPLAGPERFAAAMRRRLPAQKLSEPALARLYRETDPLRLPLVDRAYLARVHPLELWLVGWLRGQQKVSLGETLAASRAERQVAYAWLFRSRAKAGQDARIRQVIERDAFAAIGREWRRLGYPFETITPSLASAIGAAGDRPEALAELMGIVANGGRRLPSARIEAIHFAVATPFETRLVRRPATPERVLPAAVAEAAKQAMFGVVRAGTARRLGAEGVRLSIAGKTGTGDHRYVVVGKGGRVVSSRPVSRSASFLFLIGDRYFGELTVHVEGAEAARYRFSSALAIQAFRSLLPEFAPLIDAS